MLDVVLEEKLHGQTLSIQAQLPFVEKEAHPTEHSFRLSAGMWHAEVIPGQPPKSWKLWPTWPPLIQGVLALIQSWLVSVRANNYELQIMSISINNLLSSASS